MPPKVKFPCLICKNSTNNTNSVECIVCKLWTHKDCDTDLDEDTWKFINHMKKTKGSHFWACAACSASQQKFDKIIKKLTEDVEVLKSSVQENTSRIDEIDDQSQINAKKIDENAEDISQLKEKLTGAQELPGKADVIRGAVKEM